MAVHLVNPSHLALGTSVITPRWLFVLAGAAPPEFGVPHLVDETLEPLDPRHPTRRRTSPIVRNSPSRSSCP
jgi:hypothetical protein